LQWHSQQVVRRRDEGRTFIVVGADEHRHALQLALPQAVGQLSFEEDAVDDRLPEAEISGRETQRRIRREGADHRSDALAAHAGGNVGSAVASQASSEAPTLLLGDLQCLQRQRAHSAFDDDALEEPDALRRDQVQTHAPATRRLAEDGDVVRIAAEALDVALHPSQGEDLILEAEVARGRLRRPLGAERRMSQEAELPETIVEAHHHHTGALHQVARIGGSVELEAFAGGEAATVNPHHHRSPYHRRRVG
jgi:hypothetical protein